MVIMARSAEVQQCVRMSDANDKRDEYADKLQAMNRYVGTLEAQNDAQTDQQKATAAQLRTILGKVDDIHTWHMLHRIRKAMVWLPRIPAV
jgi:hypothetical protein